MNRMKMKNLYSMKLIPVLFFIGMFLLLPVFETYAQQATYPLSIEISVDPVLQEQFLDSGRMFVFLNKNPRVEPRTRTWPTAGNYIFARNFSRFDVTTPIIIDGLTSGEWDTTADWDFAQVPAGTYYIQMVWHQQFDESRIVAPGNIYSLKQELVITAPTQVNVEFSEVIPALKVVEHTHVKTIEMRSDTLSTWWGKPMELKATVLLPSGYFENDDLKYPIRYNVSGYGGRYNRVNFIERNQEFADWWFSDTAPQIINVFLDGEGPFGDSYQLDSDNSGPYGYALINELIPHIETAFRNTSDASTRFVDGCSTGGWVSLALQMFYPDHFNGVFSYSPDAVEFSNYQLINIYKDDNAFVNEYGISRPVSREVTGEPTMLLRDFIRYENVMGHSGTYLNSGGQFSAHTALYSPRGKNGLPNPLFHPQGGYIDHSVAEAWKKYDLLIYAQDNWPVLGPKLQGKVYIWMGDMDNYFLNMATQKFDTFLKQTENPGSDAVVEFTPMQGHCTFFSHQRVLEQIQERLELLNLGL
jgi:S-formylglutathione hydrolase FrmB